MTRKAPFHDALSRLVQVGWAHGIKLVCLTELDEANRYTARPVEFDDDGETQTVGTKTLTVTNLAEPSDIDGQVPANTDAVALDVDGRWVVFVRPKVTASFPARIVSSQGSGAYTVREQTVTGAGTFADRSGVSNVTAHNLAELSLGPGAAVDEDAIVVVSIFADTSNPPADRYVFDHPVYAKYLD